MTPQTQQLAETDQDTSLLRQLRIEQVTWEAEDILSLRLSDPDEADLPGWLPGAHLDVVLPSGLVRQYSLCGDPRDPLAYTVAALKDPNGRGGSKELHECAVAGRMLTVRGPRNHFQLVPAEKYLFIAGGIGITPIVAMAREAARSGAHWRLFYGGRSLKSMAFRRELDRLGGDRVVLVPQDEQGLLDLDRALQDADAETEVYCCGPAGLIEAVEQRCRDRIRDGALHVERFTAPARLEDANSQQSSDDPDTGGAFDVELRRTGQTVTVPPGATILDAVRDIAPAVMSSCEEGFCGTCETKVLEGVPEHHDTILSAAERDKGKTMMICVGRAKSARIVLDL